MIPLLRTLTLKSCFTQGKHQNVTIGRLIEIGQKKYISGCYFFIQNITYVEEILTQLGITDEYRIEKPGIDKAMAAVFFKENMPTINKKWKKAKKTRSSLAQTMTKGSMQRINHGHTSGNPVRANFVMMQHHDLSEDQRKKARDARILEVYECNEDYGILKRYPSIMDAAKSHKIKIQNMKYIIKTERLHNGKRFIKAEEYNLRSL